MTMATDAERPCTPRKRLELAKEVDRETAQKLDKPNDAATTKTAFPITGSFSTTSLSRGVVVETPRDGIRGFCESFVGGVVQQASARLS